MESSSLTVAERVAIARLFNDIRNSAQAINGVGLIEFRNLLANLFPAFADVRDADLDDALQAYANSQNKPIDSPDLS